MQLSNSLNRISRLTSPSQMREHPLTQGAKSYLFDTQLLEMRTHAHGILSASVPTAPELEGNQGPAETFGNFLELYSRT